MNRNENGLRTSRRILNIPPFKLLVSQKNKRKKNASEEIFEEIIVEIFPSIGKELVTKAQEVQRAPHRINPRRNTLRHRY